MKTLGVPALLAIGIFSSTALAQTAGAPGPAQAAPLPSSGGPAQPSPTSAGSPAQSCCVVSIPALTPVELVFVGGASSRTSAAGDLVPIRLIDPVVISGQTVLPVGTPGVAEVIQASKARMMGKAGELTLAARYLDHNGHRIPLKRLAYGPSSGRGADGAAMVATMMVGLPGMLLSGGNIDIQAGARANARVSTEIIMEPE